MPKLTVTTVIINKLGLHARPAMCFVDLAGTFSSAITVRKDETTVDGKSIMEMMMLAASKGAVLEITVEGDDAEIAAKKLKSLVDGGFEEE